MRSVARLRRPPSDRLLGPPALRIGPAHKARHNGGPCLCRDRDSRFRAGVRAGVPYAVAGAAARDLVRRPRPARDGQRGADRDVGAACSPARRSSPRPRCSAPAAASSRRSPPGSCSTCATCRWGSRSRPRCAAGRCAAALIGQAMIDFSWAAASRGGGRFDPAFMVGATAPVLSVLGRRDRDRRLRRRPDRRSRRRSASTRSSPPSSSACWSRASCAPACPRVVAGLGSLIALVLIPFTPAGVPVIAASAAALLGLRGAPTTADRRRRDERGLGHDRACSPWRPPRSAPRGRCCSAAASCPARVQGVIALRRPRAARGAGRGRDGRRARGRRARARRARARASARPRWRCGRRLDCSRWWRWRRWSPPLAGCCSERAFDQPAHGRNRRSLSARKWHAFDGSDSVTAVGQASVCTQWSR